MPENSKLLMQIGENTASIRAAHERLGALENNLRDDLRELNEKLDAITSQLDQKKGFAAGVILLAGFIGAALSKAVELYSAHK